LKQDNNSIESAKKVLLSSRNPPSQPNGEDNKKYYYDESLHKIDSVFDQKKLSQSAHLINKEISQCSTNDRQAPMVLVVEK